jgi:hypothetical protein
MAQDEASDDATVQKVPAVTAVGATTEIVDLHDRSDGELLADLAGAADRRRAERSRPTLDLVDGGSDTITDLEEALVTELRSRRHQHRA